MTEKWETYRDYTFRLEKVDGEWRTFIRRPNGTAVLWEGLLLHDSDYCTNFQGITVGRVVKKVKRWIDWRIDNKNPTEKWP